MNMGGPMTKQEEYVENAVESLELAERLASSSDRRRMLKLAEAWVELANDYPGTGFGIAVLYDVKTWIWTRGDNFPLKLLESRIRCPNCGKLGVTVLFAAPGQPKSQAIWPQLTTVLKREPGCACTVGSNLPSPCKVPTPEKCLPGAGRQIGELPFTERPLDG